MSTLDDDALAPTQSSGSSAPAPVDPRPPTLDALGGSTRLVRGPRLGRGAMGEVLACEDKNLGRTLALKAAVRTDAAALERFLREARIQGQLEHPNIVPVHELGADEDGTPYFTMKRVRGVTLADVLRLLAARDDATMTEWPRRKLLSAVQAVCRAVHFAHSRGVVHRDLKPANVMLGDHGEVYALDWGVARTVSEALPDSGPDFSPLDVTPGGTSAGAVIGTPGYMAPEQARGGVASPKSDVWALGALLFEVLTLEPLVTERAPMAALEQTLKGVNADARHRAPDRDVAPELAEWCLRATAVDPSARPTALALHDGLEAVLAGERDVELRGRIARGHADAAAKAAQRVFDGAGDALDARREALQQLGRCLALEPDNAEAQTIFFRLLSTPPREVPPSVQAELDGIAEGSMRRSSRNAALGFLLMFTAAPGLLVMGIQRWWLLGLLALSVTAAVAVSVFGVRVRLLTRHASRVAIIITLVAVGLWSTVFGPFVLVPAMLALVMMSLFLWVKPGERALVLLGSAASLGVPVLLWATGAMDAPYRFTDEGLVVVPYLTRAFPPHMTLAVLGAMTVGNTVIAALSGIRLRETLDERQRALALQGWNLRQLLPAPRTADDVTAPAPAAAARSGT